MRLPILFASALAARSAPFHRGLRSATTLRGGCDASTAAPRRLIDLTDDEIAALPEVVAIASDVDGTLTNPSLAVSARTHKAILAAMDAGILFFPATGKTRAGMFNSLGPSGEAFKARSVPGVFSQGLIVYGPDGSVVYERLLDRDVLRKVCRFCRERNISLLAYSGDRILCDVRDAEIDRLTLYKEPEPEEVGPLDSTDPDKMPIHKVILMAPAEEVRKMRPDVEALVGDSASITQAMVDMLEVLPRGANKGDGVSRLLDHLKILYSGVLAMGDAENDIEMLRSAGLSVAMGNAAASVAAAAQLTAPSNADDGAAEAIERLVLSRLKRREDEAAAARSPEP